MAKVCNIPIYGSPITNGNEKLYRAEDNDWLGEVHSILKHRVRCTKNSKLDNMYIDIHTIYIYIGIEYLYVMVKLTVNHDQSWG